MSTEWPNRLVPEHSSPTGVRCDVCGEPAGSLNLDPMTGLRFGGCCLVSMVAATQLLEAALRPLAMQHPRTPH